MVLQYTSLGVIHNYVRTEGKLGLGWCVRIAYREGGGGSGCCLRAHFLKYSSKVVTFDKLYYIWTQIYWHKMIAWENDLLTLYYIYHIKYTSNQIAYVSTGGRGVMAILYSLRTGGGQQLATFCVRTLWMAP